MFRQLGFNLASSTKLLVSLGVGDDVLGVNVDILSSPTRKPVSVTCVEMFFSPTVLNFPSLSAVRTVLDVLDEALYTLLNQF